MSERLEEIKSNICYRAFGTNYVISPKEFSFFIEQAEKAERLEQENERLKIALSNISMMCVGEVTHINIKRVARKALEGES
jgi:hypothetical protein